MSNEAVYKEIISRLSDIFGCKVEVHPTESSPPTLYINIAGEHAGSSKYVEQIWKITDRLVAVRDAMGLTKKEFEIGLTIPFGKPDGNIYFNIKQLLVVKKGGELAVREDILEKLSKKKDAISIIMKDVKFEKTSLFKIDTITPIRLSSPYAQTFKV